MRDREREGDAVLRIVTIVIAVIQGLFAARSFARMARTATGSRIGLAPAASTDAGSVTILLPVLNEEHRLGPCLDGLLTQGASLTRTLVIDGGSTDGTRALVERKAIVDPRIQLIDASPIPAGVNGKAHNLETGFRALPEGTDWVLTIDADVRPQPGLVDALLRHARSEGVNVLSVATQQELSGAGEGLVHPSMLATLVYRFGIPGHATKDPAQIQANGQCALYRRDVLDGIGGFSRVLNDVSEDVTLARIIALHGTPVGFYESDDLVRVEMYAGWRDAWDNWTRSLPMRDRFTDRSSAIGLAEATLAQGIPSLLGPLALLSGQRSPLMLLNIGLFLARIGVLAGTARAYRTRPWTYWLSPLADPFVIARIWMMWARRVHTWRGRTLVAGDHP